jgi:hypothetical protein
MLIVLSLFFLLVWLVFFKFHWLPWNRPWKITVWSLALTIALVVIGALQYYTPTSKRAVVEVHTQSGQRRCLDCGGHQTKWAGRDSRGQKSFGHLQRGTR